MILRDYQIRAVNRCIEELDANRSTLLVAATGTGKTVMFSNVARHYLDRGRIMVLAHREELIRQAAEKLGAITGFAADVEMADERCIERPGLGVDVAKIVVSTIQTQISGSGEKRRMHRFTPSEFSLVIVDEAHHGASKSYEAVVNHYRQNPDLRVLGVTATPDRADKLALGKMFDTCAFSYDIADGIDDGWLVPVIQDVQRLEGLDLSNVGTVGDDFNQEQLASVMEAEKSLYGIAHRTFEVAAGRRTLLFAVSVAQAERIAEIINRHQFGAARWLCGKHLPDERREIIRDFKANRFNILCNVAVLTEGYDDPGIECISMGRPTKSRTVYAQQIGRGTRPIPGYIDDGLAQNAEERRAVIAASPKPSLTVIDFVGNAGRHKLVTATDILGGKFPEDVVDALKIRTQQDGPVNVREMLKAINADKTRRHAEQEAKRQAEAARRASLVVKAEYSSQRVSPFTIEEQVGQYRSACDYANPPTDKQIAAILKFGTTPPQGCTKRQAGAILDRLITESRVGPPTPKQASLLRKYRYNTEGMTREQASGLIDAIAKNNWRRPDGPV